MYAAAPRSLATYPKASRSKKATHVSENPEGVVIGLSKTTLHLGGLLSRNLLPARRLYPSSMTFEAAGCILVGSQTQTHTKQPDVRLRGSTGLGTVPHHDVDSDGFSFDASLRGELLVAFEGVSRGCTYRRSSTALLTIKHKASTENTLQIFSRPLATPTCQLSTTSW